MDKMEKISLVVPCYNEEAAVSFFYKEADAVTKVLTGYEFEFIFVDDGSRDGTLAAVKALAENDARVRYIAFSRNFGKEAAMYAGLKAAADRGGDFIATMDADCQDPPSLLVEMIKAVKEEGFDCAASRRVTRKGEPPIRSFFARRFYGLMSRISQTEFVDGSRDFRLMKRQMVESVLSLKEYNRFSKGIFAWVGFKTKWLEYENVERVAGETHWSFWKLFLYSIDGIVAFSTLPLTIAAFTGLFFCLLALALICVIVVKTVIWGDPVSGYPSTICFISAIGGIQLLSIGVIGQYLSKIYLETKARPIFIARESNTSEGRE